MNNSIKNLTDNNFKAFIKKYKNNLILVDFWAEWCGPCRTLEPIFTDLSKLFKKIIFVKINIENNPNITSKYSIKSVPTLILIHQNKIIDKMLGVSSKKNLLNFIEKHSKLF